MVWVICLMSIQILQSDKKTADSTFRHRIQNSDLNNKHTPPNCLKTNTTFASNIWSSDCLYKSNSPSIEQNMVSFLWWGCFANDHLLCLYISYILFSWFILLLNSRVISSFCIWIYGTSLKVKTHLFFFNV